MLKLSRVFFLVVGVFSSLPALAGGGPGVVGATEITQLANNTQLLASYVEQAQQTIHQFNQYQAMLKNLQTLTPSNLVNDSARKLWTDNSMNDTFRNMYRINTGGQRVAYSLSNMDQQFRTLHPGYGNFNGFDFQNAYRDWSNTTREANMGSLRMAAVQADDLQSEQDLMVELSGASATAEGQLQAVQAGNRIGVATINQLQKLRQLQMAQIQAQNTAAVAAQGRREASDEMLKKIYKGNRNRVRTYDEIIQDRSR